jgi:pyridoxamine 5'-phosphate oxidase family protein
MNDSFFSAKEEEYIKSQQIVRISTAPACPSNEMNRENGSLQPDVVPVGFDFDGEYFYISGMNILNSRKYKNVVNNKRVAIVIDDLKSIDPWDPRGIKIYGIAEVIDRQGGYMDRTGHTSHTYIRIKPKRKWSWGIDEPVFVEGKFNVKKAKVA